MMLNQVFFGRNFIRSLILFSYIVPTVVAVVVWRFMLSDKTGILNHVITTYHLPLPAYWFSSKQTAMMGVIVITVWKFFPFMVLMFLAQLQSIDPEQYEAARIDGARPHQEFFFITLPFLKPVILIAMMLRTIFLFRNFDIIRLLTNGGPLNATVTIPLQVYNVTFGQYSLGMGSATSLILFLIILAMSFGYLKLYVSAQRELSHQ
jgi:multiple sugar transport system permease protein